MKITIKELEEKDVQEIANTELKGQKVIAINIELMTKFGSEFQQSFFTSSLLSAVKGVIMFAQPQHAKNKVEGSVQLITKTQNVPE